MITLALSVTADGAALCAVGGDATNCAAAVASSWVAQCREAGHRVWSQNPQRVERALALPPGTLSDADVLARSLNEHLPMLDASQLAATLGRLAASATPLQASCALVDADTDLVWRVRAALGIRVDVEGARELDVQLDEARRAARRQLNTDASSNRAATQRWVRALGVVTRNDDGSPAVNRATGLPLLGSDYRENASVPDGARTTWDAFDYARRAASGRPKLKEVLRATTPADRVHPTFHAIGAATGRMSVSEPALQSMPREGGVRGILRADEDHLLVTADLREVEPRLAAVMSGDVHLKAMLGEGRSPYVETARIIWPGEEVTKPRRDLAKTSLLATIYQQQPTGLAPRLGVSVERAAEIQSAIRSQHPQLADWSRTIRHSRGPLTSYFGRTILAPSGPHARVNYVIQGSAADLFKSMVLQAARQLGTEALWLCAHDELAVMVPEADAEQAAGVLKSCMTVALEGVTLDPGPVTITDRWTK